MYRENLLELLQVHQSYQPQTLFLAGKKKVPLVNIKIFPSPSSKYMYIYLAYKIIKNKSYSAQKTKGI